MKVQLLFIDMYLKKKILRSSYYEKGVSLHYTKSRNLQHEFKNTLIPPVIASEQGRKRGLLLRFQ